MIQKVYFRKSDGKAEIAITEDGKLEHYYVLCDGFLTGAIYVGKVKKASKQLGVFVDIGRERDGLMTYRDGLKAGDTVLVQVQKEDTETKGCALTEKITVPGRFAVLNDVGEYKFSSKISEENKIGLFSVPRQEGVGFIFRSACEYADIEDIKKECTELIARYEKIKEQSRNVTKITCIYRDEAVDVAKRYAYSDDNFTTDFEDAEGFVRDIYARKVTANGVELVFDKTEAMTVVDVNIHKFDKKYADAEETNLRANLIAVREFARQVRLRNIGGIIMLDFISLKNRENTEKLTNALKEELKKDNVRTSVELVESIGMFAITRKKRYN